MEGRLAHLRFVRDVAVVGAADLFKSLRALLVIPVLAKLLGPADYGVWVQIKVTVSILAPLVLLELRGSVVRFLGGEERSERMQRGFSAALCAGAVSGLVAAILLFVFARSVGSLIFGGQSLQALYFVRIVALLVLLDAVDQLALAYFQAARRLVVQSSLVTAEVVGEVLLIATLALAGFPLASILAALVGWKAALVVVKIGRILLEIGLALPSLATLRAWVAFGLPLMLSSFFYLLMNYGDRYLISFLLGVREVGVYSVAYAIGSLPFILMTPVDYVLYPTIARSWERGERAEVARYVEHSVKYALLILIPTVFGLAVLARPILLVLATEEFLSAAVAVPVIAAAFLIFGLGVVGERLILLANRPGVLSALYGVLAGANITLNLVLIPRAGITGAAVATLLTFAAYAAFTFLFSRGYCRVSLDGRFLAKSLLAAIAMALVVARLSPASLPGLAGAVVTGAVVYLGALVLLRSFARKEIDFLRLVVGRLARGRAVGRVA